MCRNKHQYLIVAFECSRVLVTEKKKEYMKLLKKSMNIWVEIAIETYSGRLEPDTDAYLFDSLSNCDNLLLEQPQIIMELAHLVNAA